MILTYFIIAAIFMWYLMKSDNNISREAMYPLAALIVSLLWLPVFIYVMYARFRGSNN